MSGLNGDCSDRDARGPELLAELQQWLATDQPFCHLRYGDGEFNSILGTRGRNSDQHEFFGRTLGKRLLQVLIDAARWRGAGLVRIGGWWDDRFVDLLEQHDLRHTVPWCSAGALYYGIEDLSVLQFLHALRESPRPKVLVGSRRISRAARWLGAKHVPVPLVNCWLRYGQTLEHCLASGNEQTLFIFSAGMMSCVLGWELWQRWPESQQIDVGHIFDACLGYRVRAYMKHSQPTAAKLAIEQHYAPLFR
jgi:hypothetical protein